MKRFINTDGLVDNRGVNTQNMFAYANNNPVRFSDHNGKSADELTVDTIAAIVLLTVASGMGCIPVLGAMAGGMVTHGLMMYGSQKLGTMIGNKIFA